MTSSPVVGEVSWMSALIGPVLRTYANRHPELVSGPILRLPRSRRSETGPTARPLSPSHSAGGARWVLKRVQDDDDGERRSFLLSRGLLRTRLARCARLGLGRLCGVRALALARLARRAGFGRLRSLGLG